LHNVNDVSCLPELNPPWAAQIQLQTYVKFLLNYNKPRYKSQLKYKTPLDINLQAGFCK